MLRMIALFQGSYYLITGLWAILDIKSFMTITGPKCDVWLVKMLGLSFVHFSIFVHLIKTIILHIRSIVFYFYAVYYNSLLTFKI
jgi:hypothetical protein